MRLLNGLASLNSLDIKAALTEIPTHVIPPTIEEISIIIKQIRSSTAVGPDNVPAQVLHSDVKVTANMLNVLFGKICEEEQVRTD